MYFQRMSTVKKQWRPFFEDEIVPQNIIFLRDMFYIGNRISARGKSGGCVALQLIRVSMALTTQCATCSSPLDAMEMSKTRTHDDNEKSVYSYRATAFSIRRVKKLSERNRSNYIHIFLVPLGTK